MNLNVPKILALKANDRMYAVSDGSRENLWMVVFPSGKRSWQYRYRFGGKQKVYTIGPFPAVSLNDARAGLRGADWAAIELKAGRDPMRSKAVEKANIKKATAETFGAIRGEWVTRTATLSGWSPTHIASVNMELNKHLSELDEIPIAQLTVRDRARVYDKIIKASPGMFKRINQRFTLIIDYALEQGYINANPFPKTAIKPKAGAYPAITKVAAVGELLRRVQDMSADICVGINRGHTLLAFTGQRIRNITNAPWNEFDLDKGLWTIPRQRMKVKVGENKNPRPDHLVPLPPKLVELMRQWREGDDPEAKYVCPASGDRKNTHGIGPNHIAKFYGVRLGLKDRHVPHGWRKTFSTICNEAGKNSDHIETQLDHLVPGIRGVYYTPELLNARRELMIWYEDTLIAARDAATA